MATTKYGPGEVMRVVTLRMTTAQANSLTAVSHAMTLSISDVLRFAVDELIEDIPEPRLFTRLVRIEPLCRANSPAMPA